MFSRLAPVLLLAACKFPYPADVPDDDAGGDDDAATTACAPSTIVCDDARGEYVACSPAGTVDVSMHCPLGCAPDEEKCLDIDPHNGLAMYLDMVPDPPDVVLDQPAVIDSNAGAILNGGVGLNVPTFTHVQALEDSVQVFVVRNLSIRAAVSTPKHRSRPIAILATGAVEILAPIDIGADHEHPGPGGSFDQDVFGGTRDCEGGVVLGGPPSAGGGGAGGHTAGGKGAGAGQDPQTPGGRASVSLSPFGGGCAGGPVVGSMGSLGGAGGGAVQISSRVSVRIALLGNIDASGGGGVSGPARVAGAGGGAGGVIVLEAPQVVMDGMGVALSTKGGGGAGASESTLAGNGSDGGLDEPPARGGTAPALAEGGAGGTTIGPRDGGFSQLSPGNGGGGGGAAGMTLVRTSAGSIAPQNGAAIRGPQTVEHLRTRRLP